MRIALHLFLYAFTLTAQHAKAATETREREAALTEVQAKATDKIETPALRQRIRGTLIATRPVGGIVATDIATLAETPLRVANTGLAAVNGLSEDDDAGRVLFVTSGRALHREYLVQQLVGGNEQILFSRSGDPLWDHALSGIALAPSGGMAAFVSQTAEKLEKRFQLLTEGPLCLWDSTSGSIRDTGVSALGDRPSWFPDGRRVAYATTTADSGANAPVVRILDTSTGESSLLAAGRLPVVSSDGRSVLVARGRNVELILVDVTSGNERTLRRTGGLGTPIALVDSRYLIYKGKTTAGGPSGITEHNSPLVGPKAMMAIKLMDIQTAQFTTLIPLIDPRYAITARAYAME
ncbi:MAG: hypothetical protein LH481_09325 [Burkholderiales bacterium]|nr:hypothetical protein [Burkholderiales bacterium]